MPPKRFMPGRTRNTNRGRQYQVTTPMIDLSKTTEPGLGTSYKPIDDSDSGKFHQ